MAWQASISCANVIREAGSEWSSASDDARERKPCGWPDDSMAAIAEGPGFDIMMLCIVSNRLLQSNGPIAKGVNTAEWAQ